MNNLNRITDFLSADSVSYRLNEPLDIYSTFRIGGLCTVAVFPDTAEKLASCINMLVAESTEYTVIGRGSNILFDDNGYDGVIIFTEDVNTIEFSGDTVRAGCGASFTKLCNQAGKIRGYAGFEFGCGIPGSVGGAVFMNAGAYGGQCSDILVGCGYLDTSTGTVSYRPYSDADFAYRDSVYMRNREYTVLYADFRTTAGYRDEITEKINNNMRLRYEKQPLEYPSAGSTFKRPVGAYAGALIQASGLKGYRIGGAQVSEKHAGFIINTGNATSVDVKGLIEYVKEKVFTDSGILLECEIRYIGNK